VSGKRAWVYAAVKPTTVDYFLLVNFPIMHIFEKTIGLGEKGENFPRLKTEVVAKRDASRVTYTNRRVYA